MRSLFLIALLALPAFGSSLKFGALATDRVNISPATAINSLDPMTIVAWVLPTGLSANQRIFARNGAGGTSMTCGATGTCSYTRDRATTDSLYLTTTPLTQGAWNFIAAVSNTANASGETVSIYMSSGTHVVVETSCTITNNGAGAVVDDSAQDFIIGNRSTNNVPFIGDIGIVAIFAREMTLSELQNLYLNPHCDTAKGCRAFYILGKSAATVVDLSGNGLTGTVTGATVSATAPPVSLGGHPL